MPRVNFVKKARKDDPQGRYKKGDSYFWWKFRYGGKHVSVTRPRQSQLTQSKLSQIYAAQENIEDAETLDDLVSAIEEAVSQVEEVASEYQEADEAMGGHQGINYERSEAAQEMATEFENLDTAFDEEGGDGSNADQAREECFFENLKEEALAIEFNEP